jgi:hypothetical protein
MTLQEAVELLIEYNKWRRDSETVMPMPNSKEIGIAIDVVTDYLKGEVEA